MHESHQGLQRKHFEQSYAHGVREHVDTDDELVRWLVRWRLRAALSRLQESGHSLSSDTSILILCAGEGLEGSVIADEGFTNVTVSDYAEAGVRQALERDSRLKGLVLNAEDVDLEDRSYDAVFVQDGLHHLQNPVLGFTEMLRIARDAAFFLEPHNSFAGRRLGQSWERHDDVVNYVFRWTRQLVGDVAASYLGESSYTNLSFSFWHHNIHFQRLGDKMGGGERAVKILRRAKQIGDAVAGRAANQFCGMVVRVPSPD